MAINQNHLFEDLDGVKCAIVEKNVAAARVEFLRRILEYNRYTVVVVPSPSPKPPPAAPAPAPTPPSTPAPAAVVPPAPETPAPSATPPPVAVPPAPSPVTFTVGVTDVMFNPVNAIFGRLLTTPEGHIVTLAYWQQQENEPDNEKPYFDNSRPV